MRQFSRWLTATLLVLPLLFVAGADEAFGSTLTGTMRGTVADENGGPLPGATVIFRSESLVREKAVITDSDGNFFVAGLAPGDYTVVAQLSDYQTIQQTTEVYLDKVTTLAFTLVAGEMTETVTVIATKPVVDKTATEGAVSITKEFTESLPVGRSYQNLLQFAPGVSGGSNPNMMGGTSNSNTYQIDGVSITDPVTGTFGQNINYDIIEAVDVKLTGVSAEYGGFQGGLSNVITKSGGNDFTGTMRDEIDSPSFEKQYGSGSQGEYPADRDAPEGCDPNTDPDCFDYERPGIPDRAERGLSHDIQGTFGGPIVRDSAWFYLSYSRNDTVRSQNLIYPYGGPFENGTYIRNFQGDNSSGKLTWQVVNNHKLQYTYGEDPASVPRCYAQLFWGGGCYDGFTVDFQNQGGFFWTGNWNAVWGNRILTDAKMSHWENGFLIKPFEPRPEYATNPDLIFESPSGNQGAGAAAGYPATVDLLWGVGLDAPIFSSDPEKRSREQYEVKTTVFFDTGNMGSHTMKVGIDYQEQTQVGSSVLSGNALIYTTGFLEAPPGLGGPDWADPALAYDVNNRIYYLFYDFAPPGTVGSMTKNTAVYVQDDWQLNDKWSFNLGVRFEDVANENDVGDPIFDQTGFSPRLGAAFDVTGEGKHVVKATASQYLDAIELTTLGFFEQATGGQNAYDFYLNTAAPGVTPEWALLFEVRTDPDINSYDDDLKPQTITEFTLTYEYSITPTFGIMVKGISREWDDIVGRQLSYQYDEFGTPQQNLFLLNKDNIERKYSGVILQAEKRFSNNWQLLANYTMQTSEGNAGSTGGAEQGFSTYDEYAGVPQSTYNRYGDLTFSGDTANITGSYKIPLASKRHALTAGAWLRYREGGTYSATEGLNVVVGPGFDGVQDDLLGTLGSEQGDNDDQLDNVTVFDSERGAFDAPDWWRLDLNLMWNFSFSKKVNFETRFEIFNLTDEQKPIAIQSNWVIDPENQDDGRTNYRFGYPIGYDDFQNARNYQLSFAILW